MGVSGGVLRLGDLVAERKPVSVTRDGADVVLQGYVGGERCPLSVRAEVEAAERVWKARLKEQGDDDFSELPFRTFVRDTVRAILPEITFSEAEVLASRNPQEVLALLRHLDWWHEVPTASDAEAQDETPPDEATTLSTGASSSSKSRRSTRSALASS